MTVNIAQTSNTNSFSYWLNITNQLAAAMSNVAVTTNSNTAVGNAAISGTFTANTIVANSITIANYPLISNGTYQVSNLSVQIIDYYSMSNNNGAEYLINVKDNNANNHYTTKILTTHDTANAYITEYASITTNTSIGTFSAWTGSNNVLLDFTPISSNVTIKFVRILI
jgi:hypothetical protein